MILEQTTTDRICLNSVHCNECKIRVGRSSAPIEIEDSSPRFRFYLGQG